MPHFVDDVEQLRQRARSRMEDGPVTQAYGGDKERTIAILNEALATEIVCVLRYMHHYFMATGVHGKAVADEFKEHADQEREHGDLIGERIQQLGGKPDFNPGTLLQRSVSQYIEGETLADMIKEDLVAERVVIEVYTEMIRYFGNNDPTTRIMLEGILKDEEEHANDLADLLYVVDPHTGEERGQDPGTNPLHMHGQEGGERGREKERREPMPEQQEQRKPGMTNREAAERMASGELRQRAEGGRREGRSVDTRNQRDNAEMRPARGTRSERPGAGRGAEVPPAHEPGTRGRPPRKGADEIYAEAGDIHEGEAAGTTRSAHVTNPSRKRKKVA